MDDNMGLRDLAAMYGLKKPDAYTPYAAGQKMYGAGQYNPTSGPVDKAGYRQRDLEMSAKKEAMLRRLKASQSGNYNSASYLGG